MNLDIYDRSAYREGAPYAAFAELRRSDPVHWQDIPGQRGYWALLRHADVVAASRDAATFSAERGGIILEDLGDEQLAQLRAMLLSMDPPRHQEHRRPLAASFSRASIGRLEERVREICRDIMAGVPDGAVVDFVPDVAGRLPTRVLGELLGLPPEDWDDLHTRAALAARTVGGEPDDAGLAAITEIAVYGMEHAARRRVEPPRADVTSVLLGARINGRELDDVEFALQLVQLVTAGNDTTVAMLSQGLHTLLDHPRQLAALRADPGLLPGAVEEVLRHAPPLHYFRRTATRDTEVGGVRIRAGDKVGLYYSSANRDERVFERPDEFDVRRGDHRHVAFGFGEHYCLGVHLARLEGRVFLAELLGAFPRIERAGDVVRTGSNFHNGLDSLPVRLHRHPSEDR